MTGLLRTSTGRRKGIVRAVAGDLAGVLLRLARTDLEPRRRPGPTWGPGGDDQPPGYW